MMVVDTPQLFWPMTVRELTMRNRLWVSPMCQYSCLGFDGIVGDWHLMHLGRFAAGGAGLVMCEATGVSPEGRISAECPGLWADEQGAAWSRVVDFCHEHGAAVGVQLAHAGRKASIYPFGPRRDTWRSVDDSGWEPVAPSALAYPGLRLPRELTVGGIDQVVMDFQSAAARAVAAGFDVVEIHAAHGYLIHEFLSPLSNVRADSYGGSLENRARLLVRIVRAIRDVVGPDMPVFVRLSATDWLEGGWDEHQTARVARWCSDAGADVFDISSGGLLPAAIPVRPGYQVPLSQHVRGAGGVRTCAVGLITDATSAEHIVATGQADAVMAGRAFLRNPNFAFEVAADLGHDPTYWPRQTVDGKPRARRLSESI